MLKVRGKAITLTRGDSAYITVNVFAPGGEPYVLQEGDALWFAVKRSVKDKDYVISPRKLTVSENPSTGLVETVIVINPQDTKNLDFATYVYDVSLVNEERNFVNTIIEPSQFIIVEEVCSSLPEGGR